MPRPAGLIISFLRRKYMTGFGKSKKYRKRFVENLNGMIIGWGRCETKKRETQARNILPSLSSKRASSLFTKKLLVLTPPCSGKAAAVVLGRSFRRFPHPSARQAEPPKQSGAFFQLKYTFCFQQAKMDKAEIF